MLVHLDVPDTLGAVAVDAALAGLQGIAQLELSSGELPYLYESGVVYDADERDPTTGRRAERWLAPSRVLYEGRADCEDLSAWRAAELVVSGEDPTARAVVVRAGPRLWHAVVERQGGAWLEDPSAALGLRLPGGAKAPVGFALDLSGPRDYRAAVRVDGLGHGYRFHERGREAPYAVGCCLGLAEDAAYQVGILPLVGPVLELITSVVDAAAGNPKKPSFSAPSATEAAAKKGVSEPELQRAIALLAEQLQNPITVRTRRRKYRSA